MGISASGIRNIASTDPSLSASTCAPNDGPTADAAIDRCSSGRQRGLLVMQVSLV
jgi:hypothetical protein